MTRQDAAGRQGRHAESSFTSPTGRTRRPRPRRLVIPAFDDIVDDGGRLELAFFTDPDGNELHLAEQLGRPGS